MIDPSTNLPMFPTTDRIWTSSSQNHCSHPFVHPFPSSVLFVRPSFVTLAPDHFHPSPFSLADAGTNKPRRPSIHQDCNHAGRSTALIRLLRPPFESPISNNADPLNTMTLSIIANVGENSAPNIDFVRSGKVIIGNRSECKMRKVVIARLYPMTTLPGLRIRIQLIQICEIAKPTYCACQCCVPNDPNLPIHPSVALT